MNSILRDVIDTAVDLTGAEEASLLLVDQQTDELYMRAATNFQEDFVHAFRVPIKDSLPGRVVITGKPFLLNQATPAKLKTSYLVYSMLYVPLQTQGRVFGVLGIDNRHNRAPFSKHQISLLATLAEYAANAIENARLYESMTIERNKFSAILSGMQDGVIFLDQDGGLIFINQMVRDVFNLGDNQVNGKTASEVFPQPETAGIDQSPREDPLFMGRNPHRRWPDIPRHIIGHQAIWLGNYAARHYHA